MRRIETDVLVVGTGPSGLTAAVSLATLGVPTVAISRYPGPAHTPRANHVNMRTLEVYRDLGIQEKMQAVGSPESLLHGYAPEAAGDSQPVLYNNTMGTTFAGMELMRYKSYGSRADLLSDYAAASPCYPHNILQHVVEPVLLETARERGAEVIYGAELVEIDQTPDRVRARVKDRDSGEEFMIEASYAIGADGARSTVAEQLGVNFEGETGLKDMVNMWIQADLSKYTAYRPGVIFRMVPPGKGPAGWLNVRPWDQWLIITSGSPETPDEELLERVKGTVGDPEIDVQVKAITYWQVNHLYATEYRKGRVFLAGDAAHRHPPAGGMGSNTSLQDSFNLAWKLSYVLSGKAGQELLDSYNDERQPIGQYVVERAMKSHENVEATEDALGLHLDQPADEAWASINNVFSDAPGAAEHREALAAAVKLQDYRSNMLGVELGQPHRYQSVAVIDDGKPWPEMMRDPDLHYLSTTHPGARLPHAWIEHDRQLISTIDAVGHGLFTLLIGIGGKPWEAAAEAVAAELGIELPVRKIGMRCEYDDVYGEWAEVREIGDRGALLVRPDHHIAWRAHELPDSPTDALRAALRHVLAL